MLREQWRWCSEEEEEKEEGKGVDLRKRL